MKAAVPHAAVAKVAVQRVDIGELNAGPIQIGRLVLDAVHLDLETGAAAFTNLVVSLDLAMELDWAVKVSVPLVDDWTWDGTIDLGSHTSTVALGDVTLPGLQSFSLDLSQLAADGVEATVSGLRGLQIGPLVADAVDVSDVVLPVADFALTGLGVGNLALDGIAAPAASVDRATVKQLSGPTLPLGDLTLSNLALLKAEAADITTAGLDVEGTSNPLVFTCDIGVLDITLRVIPAARLQSEELRISGVSSNASIGSIELRDVVLPYDFLNITLSQIGIETVELPRIEVG